MWQKTITFLQVPLWLLALASIIQVVIMDLTFSEQEGSAGIFLERTNNLYTEDNGAPIPSYTTSRTCGREGPLVLEDMTLIQALAKFDREMIPERVVHAKGGAAKGYFEVTHDITEYTKASLFSKIGLKTRVIVRFSAVTPNLGGSDSFRDPRGFAIKFYTRTGILDVVGYNSPVFFVRDPMLFVSMVHANKRNPRTGRLDPNTMWDFFSRNHQALPQLLNVFSDAGTPDGFRYMHGFGPHAYILVNAAKEAVYCKFHFLTDQGIKNMTYNEAVRISGENPDYAIEDLYKAIERKDYPSWTMHIQIMNFEQAARFKYNPLDITKEWPTDEYPLMPVGKLKLTRNPDNYFQEVEQLAFDPSNLIPGIEATRDRVLQARLFSYKDTQRHRLGANFMQLPGNLPLRPAYVANLQRNGPMSFLNQGSEPNYYPNINHDLHPDLKYDAIELPVKGKAARYDTSKDDNYAQAIVFYDRLRDGDKSALAYNIAQDLKPADKHIQEQVYRMFSKVSRGLTAQIQKLVKQE